MELFELELFEFNYTVNKSQSLYWLIFCYIKEIL